MGDNDFERFEDSILFTGAPQEGKSEFLTGWVFSGGKENVKSRFSRARVRAREESRGSGLPGRLCNLWHAGKLHDTSILGGSYFSGAWTTRRFMLELVTLLADSARSYTSTRSGRSADL